MREWLVATGVIEGPRGGILVQNRRRDGSLDWSPPGGVIEVHDGESAEVGLTREVAEETGLAVSAWLGPIYFVEVTAETLGWFLRVEAYRALRWSGTLHANDPDGIVVDAQWVATSEWPRHLDGAYMWVREPALWWVGSAPGSGDQARPHFRYRLDGTPPQFEVVRLPPSGSADA